MNPDNPTNKSFESFCVIPRSILYQLFSEDATKRKIALLKIFLICVAYHTDGEKRLNEKTYQCLKGEYVGTYHYISEKMQMSKTSIHRYLLKLQEEKRIHITKLVNGTRIRLLKYIQFTKEIEEKNKNKTRTTSSFTTTRELPSQKLLDMTD